MLLPAIHFFGRATPDAFPDFRDFDEQSLALAPERFRSGVSNWIFQTYLRLREPLSTLGYAVDFSDELVPGAVNVAHRDSLNDWLTPYFKFYIVGIRADRPAVKMCDWEIVQNGLGRERHHTSHIPHWPQPGLKPRESSRATRIENAGYFGRTGTTSPWLQSEEFRAQLSGMGVTFEIHENDWSDYSTVDLVIAHRLESASMLLQKPASKLINAWLAGAPALLNDEPAFREMRESSLDYLVIDSAADTYAAVAQLKSHPQLYEAMVRNGERRGRQFSVDAVRRRWLDCLENEIVPDAQRAFARAQPGLVRGASIQSRRLVSQKLLANRFWRRYKTEIRALQASEKQ
jgi:hypothetical protein